jgi:hypothetical protein
MLCGAEIAAVGVGALATAFLAFPFAAPLFAGVAVEGTLVGVVSATVVGFVSIPVAAGTLAAGVSLVVWEAKHAKEKILDPIKATCAAAIAP